jgi:alkanesulfonate monooxygenase SsuD/methylene tetrahydromethanopterin reductase-like flavin-dependent oxidoreductase (luciferase family)
LYEEQTAMKLGIVTIPRATGDGPATAERILALGRRVEELGFAGLWTPDSIGRRNPSVDPLMLLTMYAAVTAKIELGTCVLQVPLRHPVELAHRVQTLNLMSGGRLRLGVGAGSTETDFQALGLEYASRFAALPPAVRQMRRIWDGEAVHGGPVRRWPGTEGGPPLLLGAWRSQRWIDFAANECQGWIASGIHTAWEDLGLGVEMYRKAGGGRVVLANIFTDFRPDPSNAPIAHPPKINLYCTPAEAKDRLKRVADLGVDDALLVVPFDDPDQLETMRGLWPD